MNPTVVKETNVKCGRLKLPSTLSLFNDGTLQLSNTEQETISLRNCSDVTNGQKKCLLIKLQGKTWLLEYASKEEAEEWFDQIRCLLKELPKTSTTDMNVDNKENHPLLKLLGNEVTQFDREFFSLTLESLKINNSTRRRKALSDLKRKLTKYIHIPGVSEYYIQFALEEDLEKNKEQENMKQTVTDYFKELFNEDAIPPIEFQEKNNGVQKGFIVNIKGTTFYIKTHSGGPKTSTISFKSTKAVDIKEVFVYKLLELCNIGPTVHFCKRSVKDFYIITEDLKENDYSFETFSQVVEDPIFIASTSSLTNKTDESKLNDILLQMINSATMCDLFTRIFHLTDTLGNPDNFGFVNDECKLCDFTIIDGCHEESEQSLMSSFFKGNSRYNYYISERRFIKYMSYERSKIERVKGLRLGLEKMLKGNTLEFFIIKAKEYIFEHFADCIGDVDSFETYYQFVLDRATKFQNAIANYKPEE